MKFIHAADIHLDSPLHGLARYEGAPLELLRGATRRALENLVQLSLDEEVDLLLIAGDLFDGEWKDFNTGLFFIQQMRRLREADIPVHIVLGNHDAQSTLRKGLHWPDNVYLHAHKRPQSIPHPQLGVVVHGQSYAEPATLDDLAAAYPQAEPGLLNIGLLHTNLDDSGNHARYAPSHPDTLAAKGYAYWALGHVHQFKVVREHPHIVFSGNLQGRHARETGTKGCVLVTCNEIGVDSLSFHPLDVVRWQQLELTLDEIDSPEALDHLLIRRLTTALEATHGRLLALRLRLTGSSSVHDWLNADSERTRERIVGLCSDQFAEQLWLERLDIATQPSIDRALLRQRDDPIGSLLGQIDALHADPAPLAALTDELATLHTILPEPLHNGEDGLHPDDPHWLATQLQAVEQELLARLHQLEDGDAL